MSHPEEAKARFLSYADQVDPAETLDARSGLCGRDIQQIAKLLGDFVAIDYIDLGLWARDMNDRKLADVQPQLL